MSATPLSTTVLGRRRAVAVFLVFAFAYFFSALLRAITATLAPVFKGELGLDAAQLGLLAGAYFLGFSAMQLPLGHLLDRHGPKRTTIGLLAVAVVGCAGFAVARDMGQLLLARSIIGVGVSACLMAPLTLFRRCFDEATQLRANSWMLMTGSIGMLASTLPVQWMLPSVGWRGMFAAAAVLLALSIVLVASTAPADSTHSPAGHGTGQGYAAVFRSTAFRSLAPIGFFGYGGLIAMQSLWIGPWLTVVGGRTAGEAATGLFVVNASMLLAFLCWGWAMPRLVKTGWSAARLIRCIWPLSVACMALLIWRAAEAGPAHWAVWCVLTSVVTLSQPAVGQAFAVHLAGRALSAFNLVIFFGVFAVQWGLGLLIDAFARAGWSPSDAHCMAMVVYLATCMVSAVPVYRTTPLWAARR